MKKAFALTIDTVAFREAIIGMIYQRDDDNWRTTEAIKEMLLTEGREIPRRKTALFYNTFMDICRQHNISYVSYEEGQDSVVYKIVIVVNGRESQVLSYKGKERKITAELAYALYEALVTQVHNNLFIDDVKNGRI